MKDLLSKWLFWWEYLLKDDVISFYAYITTALAEIAFLWGFFPEIAVPFTILLSLSIVNIIMCSYLEGVFEGIKLEVIISRVYVAIFGILFIIGFFFDWLANIILFAIPLIISFLWVLMREFQAYGVFYEKTPTLKLFIKNFFKTKVFWIITEIFVVGVPFGLLSAGIFFAGLPIWIKILVPVIYAICIPIIPYIEDAFATKSVFGLAYDHTWSKEYEEFYKKEIEPFEKKE